MEQIRYSIYKKKVRKCSTLSVLSRINKRSPSDLDMGFKIELDKMLIEVLIDANYKIISKNSVTDRRKLQNN